MDADHEDIRPAIDYFSKHKLQRHAFAVKNNFLCGLTFSSWLRLVWEHAHRIDWWPYAPRVLFLGALAALNSLLALPDRILYGRRVAGARVNPAPVFVLGHPRTGTTHVHNLLSLDARLGWADTLSAGFPSAFLSLGGALRRLAAPLLDSTRPMDAMALSFDTPAEDELAVCALSAGASPYMPLVFMRDQEVFRDLYALRGLLEGGESSPVHTARVRLLLRLFPDARFIYLHRDPYAVFASAAHMAESYYPFTALQRLEPADVARFVLDQFELLHETYQADRALIPPGRLVELGFAELDADPVAAMRRVYRELGWPDFERALEPQLRAYAASLAGFKKNDHQRRERLRKGGGECS
ncbi:hypothetical protein QBZ16_001497 [Prototheca wickerhamii]|uniref:Sulfotransferase n=1 Tax=Prototheca wickerhamii TaxID=3111 RepID=A0AAD9ID54_PROWI|nr:hypothetical protein QBZ16_001497 [Prototheca wickerhamii]